MGAKHKIIKMAQMAKSGSGVDILYEWSKYDAKIDTICIMIASENGEQLHENKVWKMGVRVVKVESIGIIMYGPYVKSGNYADKMAWES